MGSTSTIKLTCFCNQRFKQYNYIKHQIRFILKKYRKYDIKIKILDPMKNLNIICENSITSFPSYLIEKNLNSEIYYGICTNNLENNILKFIK